MTTKILGEQIIAYTIDTVQLSNTATAAFAKTLAPKILYANVASDTYSILDDTAVNVGGGFIVVTGSEFQSGAQVLIDTVVASSVTYVNSNTLRAQVPARSAASYNLYVVNPDGGVGLKVAGITYSGTPTWVTTSPLANVTSNTVFSGNVSATGATSYANTTILPTGFNLLANGYYYGNISVGATTTYSFDIRATDDENQDSDKTFSLNAINVPPPITVEYVIVAGGGAGKGEGAVYPAPLGGNYSGLGGGGGGGGGVVTGTFTTETANAYTITVGGGGSYTGSITTTPAANGSSSSISGPGGLVASATGGSGAQRNQPHPGGPATLTNGGNAGGGSGNGAAGGLGGPLTTNGANWVSNGGGGGGGGGSGPGATGGTGGAIGQSLTTPTHTTSKGMFGGAGGNGLTVSITGTPTVYGGGGAGGATFTELYRPFAAGAPSMQVVPTSGGTGGGGNSSFGRGWVISNSDYSVAPNGVPYSQNWTPGTAGGTNTGGGGAGGTHVLNFTTNATGSGTTQHNQLNGGSGGSGIVILSIPTPRYPGSAPGATVTTPPAAPGKTVLTFNSSGTYTA